MTNFFIKYCIRFIKMIKGIWNCVVSTRGGNKSLTSLYYTVRVEMIQGRRISGILRVGLFLVTPTLLHSPSGVLMKACCVYESPLFLLLLHSL